VLSVYTFESSTRYTTTSTSQEILYGTQNPCTVFTNAFHLTLYHSLLKTAHTCPLDVLMSHYHTASHLQMSWDFKGKESPSFTR